MQGRPGSKDIVGTVTSWPSPLAVAATWDSKLVETWAAAMGKEFRIKDRLEVIVEACSRTGEQGANMILAPAVNLHRTPFGGRNAEYLSGEDPVLGSILVKAFVKGMQKDAGVAAAVKHFALNDQDIRESRRTSVNSVVSERVRWEKFYPTGMDFTWLPIQQLRQQWHARETELAATKARADALQTMLKQQLDERKKSRFEKDEIAELSAASARQQVALATAEAALQKEQQHRRALYEEVRRLNPKWRRPCKDLVQNYQVELTDWTKTLRQSHPPHKVDRRRRSSSAAGDRPHVEAQRRRSSSVAEFRKSTFDEIPRQKLSGTSAGVLPHRDQRQAESFSAMKIFGATPDLAHDLKVSFAPAEIGGFQVDAFEPFEQSDAPSARKTDAEGGVKEVEVQTDLEGLEGGRSGWSCDESPLQETAAETVPDWPKPELNVEQREEPLDLKPEPPSLGATLSEERFAVGAVNAMGVCPWQNMFSTEDCCADCCGGCCQHLWAFVCASLGCVPASSLVSMWMATLGSVPGGCLLFVKGLIFSGCGFLGGVTLTACEEYPALVSRDAGTPLPEAPEATVEVPLEAQVITSQIVAEPVQIQTEPVAAVARQLTTLPLRSARAHRSSLDAVDSSGAGRDRWRSPRHLHSSDVQRSDASFAVPFPGGLPPVSSAVIKLMSNPSYAKAAAKLMNASRASGGVEAAGEHVKWAARYGTSHLKPENFLYSTGSNPYSGVVAELKEAQCRGEALMLELFREQQELDELRRQQIVHGALRLSEPRQGVFAG
eukprot:g29199.t1